MCATDSSSTNDHLLFWCLDRLKRTSRVIRIDDEYML
jgi:hypothetical protein